MMPVLFNTGSHPVFKPCRSAPISPSQLQARPFRQNNQKTYSSKTDTDTPTVKPPQVPLQQPVLECQAQLISNEKERKECMEHATEESKGLQKELQQLVPSKQARTNYAIGLQRAALGVAAGAVVIGGITLVIAIKRAMSPQAVQRRNISKNRLLNEMLSKYIPGQRDQLAGAVKGIQSKVGFTGVQCFRKYLWYLLRERQFDQDAVDDLIALKKAFELSDQDVADAITERAKRIETQYGSPTLLLEVAQLSQEGVQRKSACRSLYSKLQYLVEHDGLIGEETISVDLPGIFGCTENDASELRILTLEDVDLDKMGQMLTQQQPEQGGEGQPPSAPPGGPQGAGPGAGL